MDLLLYDVNLTERSGGSAGGGSFFLRDLFTTPDASPVASPRTAEPGPGSLTLLQTEGQLAIVDGRLEFAPGSPSGWAELGLYSDSSTVRQAGRTALFKLSVADWGVQGCWLGFWDDTLELDDPPAAGILIKDGLINDVAGTLPLILILPEQDIYVAVVLGTTGSYIFLKGPGISSEWLLVYWTSANAAPTLRFGVSNYDATFSIGELAIPRALIPVVATIDEAPVFGTPYAGDVDAIWDVYFATAAGPTGQMSLRYHYVDANNHFELLALNDTLSWHPTISGVPEASTTITNGLQASTSYRVRVRSQNGTHEISIALASTPDAWTDVTVLQDFRLRTTGDAVLAHSGYSVTRLVEYPAFWPNLPIARQAPQAGLRLLGMGVG